MSIKVRRRRRKIRKGRLFLVGLFFIILAAVINKIITGGVSDILNGVRRYIPVIRESVEGTDGPESSDWMLILVNGDNLLPGDYSPKLAELKNGLKFDERAIGRLNAMLSAARADGLSPVVCSAYRDVAYQQRLYDDCVAGFIAKGLSREQAEKEALKNVAYPGASEHHLGLAVDIVSMSYQILDEKQEDTPELKWLLEHCGDYGFILRYPKGKESITGVTYEPWHFRFIGEEAAKEIMRDGICLEEYLSD